LPSQDCGTRHDTPRRDLDRADPSRARRAPGLPEPRRSAVPLRGAIQSLIGRVEKTKTAVLLRDESVTLRSRLKRLKQQCGREPAVGALDRSAKRALSRRPGRQVPHFRHETRERLTRDGPRPAVIHDRRAGPNESAGECSALTGRAAAQHKGTEQARDRFEVISHVNARD
jgi:hypothetical protein